VAFSPDDDGPAPIAGGSLRCGPVRLVAAVIGWPARLP